MKKNKLLIIIIIFLIFCFSSAVNADVSFQYVKSTSGLLLDKSLDIELKEAIVDINLETKHLNGIFKYTLTNQQSEVFVFI